MTSRAFSVSRLLLGALVVIAGHGLAIGGAFLAGRIAEPSEGGGYEDVAAVVSVLVLAELAVFVGALVAAIVLFVKGRRDWAGGVILGWCVGPIAGLLLALAQADSPN